MVVYYCDSCNYETTRKSNYVKHCLTKKHIDNEKNKVNKTNKIEFQCNKCGKEYKHQSSLCKHNKKCIKNTNEIIGNNSTEKDDKDYNELKELVIALNEQIKIQRVQIEKILDKKELKEIREINGSFNTINNIQNHIQVLPYNNTDLSHLTDKDYKNCIKHVNLCVLKLIEKIHFNPSKPENMNIYISNLNNKYIMVYDGTNWQLKNRQNELDRLYEEKEMMLEEWLEENNDTEIKDKFIKYLNNKEKDETLNFIKDEFKLLMYNNKNLLK
jgi:hypothetical protein